MKLKKVTAALTAAAMLLAPIDGVWANTVHHHGRGRSRLQ